MLIDTKVVVQSSETILRHLMNTSKCPEISGREEREGDSGSRMRPLQDQDSSFSVRENEVKSNLIAITGDNSRDNEQQVLKRRK